MNHSHRVLEKTIEDVDVSPACAVRILKDEYNVERISGHAPELLYLLETKI